MSALSLHDLAAALGGHVDGNRVLAPGPNHSAGDRSMAVTPAKNSDGFTVRSFALDNSATCTSYVKAMLGGDLAAFAEIPARNRADEDKQRALRIARAREIWAESVSPIATPVESYLWSRGLDLPEDIADSVVRHHPRCWWQDELTRKPFQTYAMVAALRDIRTDEVVGIQRTRLELVERDGALVGAKRDRRMSGIANGAAVKLEFRRHSARRIAYRRRRRDVPNRAPVRATARLGARLGWGDRSLPRPGGRRVPDAHCRRRCRQREGRRDLRAPLAIGRPRGADCSAALRFGLER